MLFLNVILLSLLASVPAIAGDPASRALEATQCSSCRREIDAALADPKANLVCRPGSMSRKLLREAFCDNGKQDRANPFVIAQAPEGEITPACRAYLLASANRDAVAAVGAVDVSEQEEDRAILLAGASHLPQASPSCFRDRALTGPSFDGMAAASLAGGALLDPRGQRYCELIRTVQVPDFPNWLERTYCSRGVCESSEGVLVSSNCVGTPEQAARVRDYLDAAVDACSSAEARIDNFVLHCVGGQLQAVYSDSLLAGTTRNREALREGYAKNGRTGTLLIAKRLDPVHPELLEICQGFPRQ